MIDLRFSHYALGICAAVGILAGCGGSQAPVGAPGQSESGLPEASVPADVLYGTDWIGSGHDSTLGDMDYELTFCDPPKDPKGEFGGANAKKEAFLAVTDCPEMKAFQDHFDLHEIKRCRGIIKVRLIGEQLGVIYRSKCGQVFHNGGATLDFCQDCKGSIRRH
jgi:hypothetical protein